MRRRSPQRPGRRGAPEVAAFIAKNPYVAAKKGFARVCEQMIPEISTPGSQTRSDAPKAPRTSRMRGEFWKGGRSPHLQASPLQQLRELVVDHLGLPDVVQAQRDHDRVRA